MRIAIDCRKIADFGIGTYVRGLVHGLAAEQGSEEYVLLVPRRLAGLPERFEQVVVDVANYSVRELPAVARAVRRARADLLHAPHFVLPWGDVPAFATIHDVIPFHYPPPNPVARLYLAAMIPRALRKSARVVTVSDAAKRSIVDTFDCDAGKIVVTPNGVDEIFFDESIRPAAGRFVLFVGNDKPHKNVERLVEAFEQVRVGDPALQLVLVGAPFERFASRSGIVTPGFVPVRELVSLYRGAVALVLPSLEEGFGLPAAEAMAAGAPVLAAAIPSLREVCGEAALWFDPRSSASIGQAIARAVEDGRLRDDLRSRGRLRARQFTWRRCAALTRDAYLSVLRPRH